MKQKQIGELPIKGLTARWVVEVLSIIVIVIFIVEAIGSIVIYSFYYNSVRQNITSRLNVTAEMLASYNPSSDYEFELEAKEFLADYPEKKQFEVQVFDRFGNMIVSSQGFRPEESAFNDYVAAKNSQNGMGEWIGTLDSGEQVMAVTAILPATDRASLGAVRVVVSLDEINSTIRSNILLVIVC